MKLSYESQYQIGDQIQFRERCKSGWNYYGTILDIYSTFGCPPELTIRLDGMIMPDGDRTEGIDDPVDPTPTVFRSEHEVEELCLEAGNKQIRYRFAFPD